VPRLATWIERRRIKGWDRQLDDYFPPGLDELSVELADDLAALGEALEGYRKLHEVVYAAAGAQHLDWTRVRRLERAVRPVSRLCNNLAAKYDLVQGRRYEHACKTGGREIPWREWTRDNPRRRSCGSAGPDAQRALLLPSPAHTHRNPRATHRDASSPELAGASAALATPREGGGKQPAIARTVVPNAAR
jgi:hypothetical protein